MDETWTISELAERAAAAVAADGSAQVSGRVRDLPNERLIRWYTTIGLVDPPLGRRGRTALYGFRHLLQLVAVKRRQAAGRSIAEIQVELAAATNETLERIASLPPQTSPPAHAAKKSPPAQPAIRQAPTKKSTDHPTPHAPKNPTGHQQNDGPTIPSTPNSPTPPAPPAAIPTNLTTPTSAPSPPNVRPPEAAPPSSDSPHTEDTAPTSDNSPDASTKGTTDRKAPSTREGFWSARPDVSYSRATVADDYGTPHPPIVQGIRLAPGLTLLLDVPAISGDDLAAIEDAARPLLGELRRRGLLTPPETPSFQPAEPSRRPQ